MAQALRLGVAVDGWKNAVADELNRGRVARVNLVKREEGEGWG